MVEVLGQVESLLDEIALSDTFAGSEEPNAAGIGLEDGSSVTINWIHGLPPKMSARVAECGGGSANRKVIIAVLGQNAKESEEFAFSRKANQRTTPTGSRDCWWHQVDPLPLTDTPRGVAWLVPFIWT